MATVKKKVKKAQDGLCNWSDERGGGVSCGRGGGPKTEGYSSSFKMPKLNKREQAKVDREEEGRVMRLRAKRLDPIMTAPGVRPNEKVKGYKKGPESFFGSEKETGQAKYGRKVVKKAVKKTVAKKAKAGIKIKSKKK